MAHVRAAVALLWITVAPIAFADETDADIAKGLENLRTIYAIAQVIDTRVMLGTGVPQLQPQLDPWGTPYRVETTDGYRIIGAGRDRQFEETHTGERLQFSGLDGDAVLENGAMIRSNRNWLYAFAGAGSAAAAELAGLRKAELLFMLLRSPVMQKVSGINLTLTAMERVGALVEQHRTRHGELPQNEPLRTLAGTIADPNERLMRDAWGTPFQLLVEGDTWRLISAGADRKFDPASWTRSPEADAAEDIVLEKEGFTRRVDPKRLLEKTRPEVEAIAQPPDSRLEGVGPWVSIDKSISPPVAVERIEPEYPEDYRRARISGIVILQIAISDTGAIDDIRLLKSKAPELDMSAITAVRKWIFKPATKDGKPIPVLFSLTINFKLK